MGVETGGGNHTKHEGGGAVGEHIWRVSTPERGHYDAPCCATKVVWMGFRTETVLLISTVALISKPQEIKPVAAHSLEDRCQLKALKTGRPSPTVLAYPGQP